MSLVVRDARVLTLARAPRPRRGAAVGELSALEIADVFITDDAVSAVGNSLPVPRGTPEVDAGGRVLMPGFVDCHTHACWAGDRLDEWEMRLRGATYQEIQAAGGGIMSTVRAVRAASQDELEENLVRRLDAALRSGTTTIEVKSGYGLSTADELKMLRAIRAAAERWPGTVVPTALLGHALDPDVDPRVFVDRMINETLPAVHGEFPGIPVDAFCESGAWSRDECCRLFERAHELGHPVRVHADQFTSLGMVPAAIHLGARSVDHLEATRSGELAALAASNLFAVMLPCCGFHLDGRYADARGFVDRGGLLCIATNCNPGSAPCSSMPMAIALAVRHGRLTPEEAIGAATINPATLLALHDRGTIDRGQRADLILLRHTDERMLACEFGAGPVDVVIAGGRVTHTHP
jgi:imidazolonepropionase